jgi:acetyl esterase/lipase
VNSLKKNMMRTLILLLSLPLAQLSYAGDFWAHRISERKDIAYAEDPLQKLDLIVHGTRVGEPNYFEVDTTPRPTLMWIHGGGWISGDKSTQTSQLIPYLQRGWNVYNVNYRQGPKTAPLAVDDVMCAYKFIVEQLAEQGQPTNTIVVSGASAGGHLALTVGMLNTRGTHPCRSKTPPKAIVNWFGITDIELVDEYLNGLDPQRNYARFWTGSAAKIAAVSAAFSPIYLINSKTPPIITIHGTNDTVVPYDQAESLHAGLTTPNELVTLKGGNHSGFTNEQYVHAYEKIFAFLDSL